MISETLVYRFCVSLLQVKARPRSRARSAVGGVARQGRGGAGGLPNGLAISRGAKRRRLHCLVGPLRVQPGYILYTCPTTSFTRSARRIRPMSWNETDAVKERARFVEDHASGQWTMAELCVRFGISRPTGYLWVKRFADGGAAGLEDRSRAPRGCPHQTPDDVVKLVLEAKRELRWGARKLRKMLADRHPDVELPSRSTMFDILKRNGLTQPRRRRTRWKHPGAVPLVTTRPNQVWTAEFKGQFRTRDGVYCYPLTIVDHYSRSLLRCHGLPSVRTERAKPVFERLFRELGLPEAIRSDNGSPFASTGIHGLSQLNAWWMRPGIVHQRMTPASPQENGAHERMHRTLKAETTRPPAKNMRGQQRKFDEFRARYNDERPHEALDDETPASRYEPSPRPYPAKILPPEYPGHMEVRRVSNAGIFRMNASQTFLSQALNGEYIGLEEVDDALWNVVYYDTLLGRFDQRTGRMTGLKSNKERVKDVPGQV
jgi:transposase InsO family protein